MRNLEAMKSFLRQMASTMGMKTTTTGVLLTKPESTATMAIMTISMRTGELPAIFSNQLPSASMTPVLSKLALRINMQATVIGAGWEKTLSAL